MKKDYFQSRTRKILTWKSMFEIIVMLLTVSVGSAQVTTNSGSGLNPTYADLDAAIIALNGATITSPVVITLDPANPQTAPAGGYAITAQGDAINTILIQGSGNTITASGALTVGALNDAIFKLIGADYVTLENFVMQENAANTVTTAASNTMTEWGVAVLYASTTNGAQNNTIQNNTILLNRTYQNTFGIYSNSTHAATTPTATATATTATGGNHRLRVFSNAISNVNQGIVVVGPTAAADQNTGIDIGGSSLATANTITNFGTTGTFSSYPNVSGTVNGILVRNSYGSNVSFNTVTSSVGGVTAGNLNGIHIPASSNAPTGITFTNTINNNTISLRSGLIAGLMNGILFPSGSASTTSTLNINNNDFNTFGHTVAGTGSIIFISSSGADLNKTINGNTFTNISLNTTGSVTFIANSVTRPANAICNVNNNAIVNSFSKTGAGGTITFYTSNSATPPSGTENNLNNNFSNIVVTGATTIAGWGSTDGSTTSPFGPGKNVSNNTFSNITGGTSAITILNVGYSNNGSTTNNVSNNIISNITNGAGIVGITSVNGTQNFFGNTVSGLSTTGASTVSSMVVSGGVTQNIYKNKIYNIEANNVAGIVNGVLISGGTTITAYNNIIGDLRTPNANAANPLNGINITGGTTVNVYNNTVMLNATSVGALFGSSAISASTASTVALQNNIFVNNSTTVAGGLSVAYRRSSTTLTSYATASNNNLFYASNIFTDGTNTDATLAAYKSRVTSRDALSISENPAFVSTTGSNANFLHIDTAVGTLIEGGGATVAVVTDDFDGDTRNATTPDIGADEFTGTPLPVVVINSVTINPVGNLCTAVSRTVTANITAGSNNISSVTLNYSFNGVAQTPITMTGGTVTAGSTSDFTAVIPVAVPANASVTWNVVAVDPLTSKATSGTPYQDEPLFGSTATANASMASICNGGSTVLSATLSKNGTISVGSGALTTSASGTVSTNFVSPFTHYFGGYKAQYIVRSSELSALGFTAGSNLTSLAFDVTTASTIPYTGFTLRIGTTPANVLTTTFDTASLTQMYTGDLAVSTTGLLTLPFGTGAGSSASFVWDGTSNVLINLCWSNSNLGGGAAGSAEVKYDATSFASLAYYRIDSTSQPTVCGTATATAITSNRPKMVFGGNIPPLVTSISWSDGSTVVGTGNNLSVSPTANTTYTATLTAAGCTIDANAVAVSVTTVDNTVSQAFEVLTANQAGATYQWFTCPGNVPISGETGQSYTAAVNGDYGVTVTLSGCPVNSSCVTVSTLGVSTFDKASGLKAYPNPVSNILNIEYTSDLTKVSVHNMLGQQVLVKKVTAAATEIDMSGLNAGTYFVKVEANDVSKTFKVVRK